MVPDPDRATSGPDRIRPPIADELADRGFAVRSGVVRRDLVDALTAATDRALAEEATAFPIGDDQHGRLLFAPVYGGPFLELLGNEALLGPIEELIGTDVILYTMTTSVLSPGSAGAVHDHHVDLAADRPHGLALAAMVLLDDFTVGPAPPSSWPAPTGLATRASRCSCWADRVTCASSILGHGTAAR